MITTFEVLADPTRRRILELLRERPRLVGELVELLQISQPGVSKQLRVLREAGLVRVRQEAQRHWYELRPEPLMEIDSWLASYRRLWEERLDRLDNLLTELQEQDKEKKMTKAKLIAEPGSHQVIMSRIFDAPRELVFNVMTDPKHIPQWWGKRNHTTIVDKMDVRAGGLWRYVERDEQGNEFAFHGVYHAITAPERVVDTFEFEGMPGHVMLETLTLEAQADGKTRLTVSSVFQSVADRDGMLNSGMAEGANESYDRLDELLAKM